MGKHNLHLMHHNSIIICLSLSHKLNRSLYRIFVVQAQLKCANEVSLKVMDKLDRNQNTTNIFKRQRVDISQWFASILARINAKQPCKYEGLSWCTILAPVPLSIFRSNSKFDENSKHSSVKYTRPITTIFAHVTTVSLSWRVQNIVVIGWIYLKLERSEFSSNFEFDRNMLSGTGARWH